MKIAVCEDNYTEACDLEQMIREVAKEHNIPLSLDIFSSGENLLSMLKSSSNYYHIYFIDICLEERALDGLETAKQLKAMDKNGKLVFVTISREYAVDAFSLNALHYLVKPFTRQQIEEIFKRYDDRQLKKLLVLPWGKEEVSLYMENILYVESSHNYCILATSGGEITVRIPMREMEERLDGNFLRLNRSIIVHMDFIQEMRGNQCILKNGRLENLSRNNRQKLRSRYKEYICNQVKNI